MTVVLIWFGDQVHVKYSFVIPHQANKIRSVNLFILSTLLFWMWLKRKAVFLVVSWSQIWIKYNSNANNFCSVESCLASRDHFVDSLPQRHYNQLREELAKLKPPAELEAESEAEFIDPKGKQYSTDAAQASAATPSSSSVVPKPTNAPTTSNLSVNSIGLGPYVGPNGMFFTDPMDQDLPDVWCRLGPSRYDCGMSEKDLCVPFYRA